MNKWILTTFILISGVCANASDSVVSLSTEDIAVSALSDFSITTEPLCPENVTCILDGTRVNIQMTLMGCMDRIGPVGHRVSFEGDTAVIYLSAMNIHNRASLATTCFIMPTETYSVDLINHFGPIEVLGL